MPPARKTRTKRATEDNKKAVSKEKPDAESSGDVSIWETKRRITVSDRRAARSLPWKATLAATGAAFIGWLVANPLGLFINTTPGQVAAVFTVATALVATTLGVKHLLEDRTYFLEITVGGVAAATFVGLVITFGLTWWLIAFGFGATLLCGARWWRAHPVGPTVPALEPERPGTDLVLAPSRELATTGDAEDVLEGEIVESHDVFVERWELNLNRKQLRNTMLRDGVVEEFVNRYVVELDPGVQDFAALNGMRNKIASGLKTRPHFILLERHDDGEHLAQLSVVTKDPIAEVEFFTEPTVENGVIKDLARFQDGVGTAEVQIYDASGVIPTMVVGSTGSGKSAATNTIYVSAMSDGLRNDIYMDPKLVSSPAIAKRARIAILGEEACKRAPELVEAIYKARQAYALRNDRSILRSTPDLPGWMIIHDEFSAISGDTTCAEAWRILANVVRAFDMWPVALNQALQEVRWGSEQTRSAFAQQVVACRIASKSSSDLVAGLEYRPVDLPSRPRGMAVLANSNRDNVPCRWRWLPADDDQAIVNGIEVEPPIRLSAALDKYITRPDIHKIDYDAIVNLLGPPNEDGRWVVGGPNATHEFPSEFDEEGEATTNRTRTRTGTPKAAPSLKMSGWGKAAFAAEEETPNPNEEDLTVIQSSVLKVIRGGTERTRDIMQAAQGERSAIHDAIDELIDRDLVVRVKQGHYKPAEAFANA